MASFSMLLLKIYINVLLKSRNFDFEFLARLCCHILFGSIILILYINRLVCLIF